MAVGRKKIGALFVLACLAGLLILSIPAAAGKPGIQVTAITDAGQKTELQFYSGYHALVIGCSAYTSGWPKLAERAADAQEIATSLTDIGWTVDYIADPDGQTLRHALRKLVFNQGRDRERAILIWFSGHGYTLHEADGTGLGFLVPTDAPDPSIDPVGFTEKALSMRELETFARQLLVKHALMVFDSSASGDVFLMERPQPDDRIRESMAAPARQVLFAGENNHTTSGPSILKKPFIRGILKRDADLNKDGCVTGRELGAYVSKTLASTEQDLTRYYGRIDNRKLNQGDFIFALPGAGSEKDVAVGTATEIPEPSGMKKTFANRLGMTFQYIPPGHFMMGSPVSEPGREKDENRHRVTLTRGFYLQTTEVTQNQWKSLMGGNPATFLHCGGDCPIENVSWDEVQAFIQRLNREDGNGRYRLPSEAEWEYACRAGSETATYAGDMQILGQRNAPVLSDIAWYGGNSCVGYPQARMCSHWQQKQMECANCGPHGVGLKAPNAWGLYDMLGNVYEWCQDYFADYPEGETTDPAGPTRGTRRMARGGGVGLPCKNLSRRQPKPLLPQLPERVFRLPPCGCASGIVH